MMNILNDGQAHALVRIQQIDGTIRAVISNPLHAVNTSRVLEHQQLELETLITERAEQIRDFADAAMEQIL